MTKKKVVVFTGAGMSAPSGISTFRDADGLWEQHSIEEVATPEGWKRDQDKVLKFYNDRRAQLAEVEPNAGHKAIASLEEQYDVVVVTQNVDNLHERGGSSHILHLHGELTKVRSTKNPADIFDVGTRPIVTGDCCDLGGQLRPHIVWFGEQPQFIEEAVYHINSTDILIVAGTSLKVYPAAGLIDYAPVHSKKYLIDLDAKLAVPGYSVLSGSVDKMLPELALELLE